MILNYKTSLKKKLLFKNRIFNDFTFFIFLFKEYLKIKNIYTHNTLKFSIFLLNLFSIKFLFYIQYINIHLIFFYKKNIFYSLYSIEMYCWIYQKHIKSFFKIKKKFFQKIVLINKTSRTRAKGRIKRYKVIIIIGNKNGWFGLGYHKDYYIQDAISKARLNAFKNIYILSFFFSNIINNRIKIQNNSKKLYLFFSKYKTIFSKNYIIRVLFDFIGLININSKTVNINNIYNIINMLLTI